MVHKKRKAGVRKVRAAKKKAKKVLRTLKRVSAAKSRAVKKRPRARLPARAHKAAAPKAALAVKALAPKPDDKSAKAKTPIKSAKQALELLEAKVNEVKAKGKGGRGGRRGRKDEWLIPAEMPKEDAETRRTRLKNLIKLGKERGFLTYSEINDHLPDDLVDAEQIEAIISTFGDMGIQVYDQAPDQETLLIASDATPVAQTDEDVEEQAEAALSTVDSEFGRTTDPVRMYMREMGSVELLTREGEIEIAKRIEEGLRHMIQAISACPTTVREILELADKVEKDESRVDEVVDGLIDPNAKDDFDPKKAESPEDEEAQIEEEEGESEEDEGAAQSASLLKLRGEALEKFARIRRLYDKMAKALEHKGSKDKDYLRARDQISNELMGIRFTARTVDRRSEGAPRQARDDRGQPAAGDLDRQEVHQPRAAVPRPDPGRQHRPDEGGRQVRIPPRLQVLDLCHVVDPAGDHALDRRPGAHHPHPGAHDRDHQQDEPHQPPDPAGDRPGAGPGDARRAHGDARGEDPQDPQDLQGADLDGDADRRRRRLAPRRFHRGPVDACALRRGDLRQPARRDEGRARHAHAARGQGAAHALRHRDVHRPHAGGGRQAVRRHARAHTADRG